MIRHILVVLCLAGISTSVAAAPRLGVKTKRVGKNIVLVNPVVKKLVEYEGQVAPKAPLEGPPHMVHPLTQPDSMEGYDLLSRERVTRQFGPSQILIRHYSSGTDTIEPISATTVSTFSDDLWDAVELAPDWLQIELMANLTLLPPELRDELGKLMTEAEDPRYLDEIAFLIANTSPDDLATEEFRPRYISDQAEYVYKVEPMLDYVTLKEYGEAGNGDYWTTTVYKYTKDGEEMEYELPREEYYWWVVHTRLDGEPLYDIRPDTGKFDEYPLGLTFKEYYMYTPDETAAYTTHYIFKNAPPKEKFKGLKEIPYESLNNWGPSQRGAFVDPVIGPSNLTFDSQGRPTTIEFKIRPKGVVLATTLLVEKGYAEGKSDLLQTMLRYGPGNVVQDPEQKHLVIMDNTAPFGHEGVIQGILDEFEVNYEVIGSDMLADADLSEVRKIIVPSDQPLELYQVVVDNTEKLKEWLKPEWRILELHCAVSSAEKDWSGLVIPGGFTVEGVADQDDDLVEVEGQPPLKKLIADTKYLWDFEKHPGLSGDRLFDPDTFALDKIGWWSSQNIWDSVIDWGEKHPWIMPERSVQAVRVLYNHFGNCGENQDIITAASRSCLVPTSNTSNGCEDHVWSEYFIEGEWHTYQMGWADAPTDIDHPAISSGKKWGGGKNISFVTQTRGDGVLNNRTDYYHYTGKLNLTVVDGNGDPIKGAVVLIATETYYKQQDGTYPLTFAFWDVADEEGKVTLELGANIEDPMKNCLDQEVEYRCNNYYLKVLTWFGNYPAEDGEGAHVVDHMEAVKGFEKDTAIQVEGVMPSRKPTGIGEGPDGNPAKAIMVNVNLLQELACGISLYSGKFCEHVGEGIMDFYLLDQTNATRLMQQLEKEKVENEGEEWEGEDPEPFEAMAMAEGIAEGFQFMVHPPHYGDWYLVMVSQNDYMFEQVFDVTFDVLERTGPLPEPVVEETADDIIIIEPAEDTVEDLPGEPAQADTGPGTEEPKNDDDGGCSLNSRSPAAFPAALLMMLFMVGLAGLRRRRIRH